MLWKAKNACRNIPGLKKLKSHVNKAQYMIQDWYGEKKNAIKDIIRSSRINKSMESMLKS